MKRELDTTGVRVVPIGLGGMPLSIAGRPDEAQAITVIEAFVKHGGNLIDTANVYCLDDTDVGHNERLINKALITIGMRDKIIVATKGGLRRPRGAWTVDGRPEWLRTSCEKSLRDLDTDVITLYQLHAVDKEVKFSDSLEELVRLQQSGKILHIGLSNVEPDQLEFAFGIAKIVSVQNRCNPFFKRDFKNGLVSICQEKRVTYIPHSTVGGHNGHVRLSKHAMFQHLSEKYATSPYEIALAWLLHKGEHIVPIPGATKVSSIVSSLQAIHVKLEVADIDEIDRIPDE